MTDIGSGIRGARVVYTAGRYGAKIANQRAWLRYLQHRAVLLVLKDGSDIATAQVSLAAEMLCDVLNSTEIPLQPRKGVFASVAKFFRDRVTHGTRYPEYKGLDRRNFWDRLYRWVKAAAETDRGREALDHARFHPGSQQSHVFACRVVGETLGLLLEPVAGKQDRFRFEMANELNDGLTEVERQERYRRLQIVVRSVTAGAAAVAVSQLGFHNDWLESLGLGVVALGVTGVADAVHGGLGRLTSDMAAARRQANSWLLTLSSLLMRYVQWANDSVGHDLRGGVDNILYVLSALRGRQATINPEFSGNERILDQLKHIINRAEQAEDHELSAALIDLETAIMFDLETLPRAMERLVVIGQGVPKTGAIGEFEFQSVRHSIAPLGVESRRLPQQSDTGTTADLDIPIHPLRRPE